MSSSSRRFCKDLQSRPSASVFVLLSVSLSFYLPDHDTPSCAVPNLREACFMVSSEDQAVGAALMGGVPVNKSTCRRTRV